jgi:cholesterol oxidase
MNFDVIVIGSGFGGAITACRLAEGGYKVLILERGRRWQSPLSGTENAYPRKPEDPWLWDQCCPERENGWLDLRHFPRMTVLQGAAVGGGSLIYANISCEAPPKVFKSGWPAEITYNELKPYYDAVAQFMNVQKIPPAQWNPRTKLMQEAAQKIGEADRFRPLELAVTFDPDLRFDPDNPPDVKQSISFTNAYGAQQGTCVHLGNCDIGCDVYAKNTLDKNYIPRAEKHKAEVRPLHLVTNIEPITDGYRVSCERLENHHRIPTSATARIVIVACGSLGSTELLLRCRKQTKTLTKISPFLGRNWSSNGDFLTPAFYQDRHIAPSRGPTISSAIDFQDSSQQGQAFWIEDGGFPNLLADYARTCNPRKVKHLLAKMLIENIQRLLVHSDPFKNVMPWFAQGVDAANGVLSLKRPWWFFGPSRLHLDWDIAKSEAVITAIVDMHKKLSTATGAHALVSPDWSIFHGLITPHPLGGCNMGNTPANGVVNHRGEVFGYRNLFVADAAIIPEALGVNPSRTIGALAERIARLIVTEGR